MPMQGKLIATVLVPAQTQPQRKKLSEQEQATASGILLGFFFFFVVAVAISMRRSAHTAKNQYSTFSAQVEQNKQDAENWKQANLDKIKKIGSLSTKSSTALSPKINMGIKTAVHGFKPVTLLELILATLKRIF